MRSKKKGESRKSLKVSLLDVQWLININKMIGFYLLIILLEFLIKLTRLLHAFLSVNCKRERRRRWLNATLFGTHLAPLALWSACFSLFIIGSFYKFEQVDKRFVLCFCVW